MLSLDAFRSLTVALEPAARSRCRARYIDTFVDTSLDWYKTNIEALQVCSDGQFCSGYLWEVIKPFQQISVDAFQSQLESKRRRVFVMWDIHSVDKVRTPDYWKFSRDAVLEADSHTLAGNLKYLPEDIYLFDESFSWTLVATHEWDDDGNAICGGAGLTT